MIPGKPVFTAFGMVAFLAGWDAIARPVFSSLYFWLNMIKRQAFVINGRVAAIRTTVIPGVFDRLTPQAFSLFISHCLKIVKVIFDSLASRNCLRDHWASIVTISEGCRANGLLIKRFCDCLKYDSLAGRLKHRWRR